MRELEPIAVEVRLRPHRAPTTGPVDDVLGSWLRAHRFAQGTPGPIPALTRADLPPPVPRAVLQTLIQVEPPRRGTLWPLAAVSLGLAAALVAATMFL